MQNSDTDLNSKPLTPSDLRESFSSIYCYENVVNVKPHQADPYHNFFITASPRNLYPYQVEHTNKNKSRKKGHYIDLKHF